uniref:Uncharacterized protein n=1 Tax=Candidatus Methanophaga sp. ANME-1 ERB7 TaxID=2759913 RepID=A0A7G9Z628_9EURY|nr:hypothetical protein MNGCPPAP_00009 [Methanosarcinales archaeon ANME-1 ERB7]
MLSRVEWRELLYEKSIAALPVFYMFGKSRAQ